MCQSLQVGFPIIDRFLMLYSLKCGTVTIVIWTIFRSIFCMFFFMIALLEVMLDRECVLGRLFIFEKPAYNPLNEMNIYYIYLLMIVTESMVFVSCIHLTSGMLLEKAPGVRTYLSYRIITWLLEVVFLFTLCLIHMQLLAWYLILLMLVILELYSLVVVNSYCTCVLECPDPCCEEPKREKDSCFPC